jgi:oligoribonuclease
MAGTEMATSIGGRYHSAQPFDGYAMEKNFPKQLIWIDLEMTGLDTAADSILEIATIVTDNDLNELAEGPAIAIRHSEEILRGMDTWNMQHHTESGLWKRVLESDTDMREAQRLTLEFLAAWTSAKESPMCGNSICQDRRFLHRLMPDLESWFHYRNLDVSSLKELATRWCPEAAESLVKQNRHRALDDIRESIAELRHYRAYMGAFGGYGEAPD